LHQRRAWLILWMLLGRTAAAQQVQPPVFGARTTLIHVDALVTDKKGVPIADLQAADFEIESSGKRFPAQVATFVSMRDPSLRAPDLRDGAKPKAQDVRRVVTFLFALPRIQFMESGSRAQVTRFRRSEKLSRMLGSYLEKWMEPSDMVAIVSLESPRPLLNRLSADPVVIARTVKNLTDEMLADTSPALFVTEKGLEPIARYDLAVAKVAQEAIDRMAALPGRKLLFVLAPTLRLNDIPGRPMSGFADVRKELEEVVRRANRTGVTIHGITTSPPRGAIGPPPTLSADRPDPMATMGVASPPGSDAVASLAERTGGSTSRDIDSAEEDLARVMERNRGYYLLGYDDGRDSDDEPRKIRVRVRRSGTVVTTRPVVYPDRVAAVAAKATASAQTLEESLDSALAVGDLDVRIGTKIGSSTDGTAALEVMVTIGPNPGQETSSFDLLLRVRDEHAATVKLEQAQASSAPEQAARFTTRVLLPRPGVYQVDVAVREGGGVRRGNASLTVWTPESF